MNSSEIIGRITKEILDERVKPFENLKGSHGRQLDLESYMKKHIYMFSSDDVYAEFRIVKSLLSDIIDILGKDVRFSDEGDTQVTVCDNVNEKAMEQFAKSFAPFVTVLKPESLAK